MLGEVALELVGEAGGGDRETAPLKLSKMQSPGRHVSVSQRTSNNTIIYFIGLRQFNFDLKSDRIAVVYDMPQKLKTFQLLTHSVINTNLRS